MDPKKRAQVIRAVVAAGLLLIAATTLIELLFQHQVFPALGVEERATLRTDLLLIIPARLLEACLFVCLYVWAKEALPGATLRKKGLVLAFALIGGAGLAHALVALGDFHVTWPAVLAGFLGESLGLLLAGLAVPRLLRHKTVFG